MKRLTDIFSLKNLCFRKKMLIIYVICIIIPFSVLTVFYYSITVNKIEKQNISDLNYAIEKTRDSIQNVIDNVIMISDMIYTDEDIFRLLSSDENNNMILVAGELDERVMSFVVNNNVVENISIYTTNDALYRSEVIKKPGVVKAEWMDVFKASGVSFMPITYYDDQYKGYTLSLVRTLRKNEQSLREDILKVDIKVSAIIESLDLGSEKYGMYLLDDENKIVFTAKNNDGSYMSGDSIDINEKGILYEEVDFPEQYKIVGEYDFDIGESIFNRETLVFILIVSALFMLATVMIFIITNNFVRTLTKLTEATKKIKEEKFELIDTSNIGNDEIGVLTLGMNSAIKKINELINNIYKEKLKSVEIEKEKQVAEFNALQSQINPHFMFNLFEVIRMKSLKRGDKETAVVMKNISLMFRNLIKWGDDLITLDKEMMFVNAFLYAQRYNMDNEVEINLDIDEDARNCVIPKMTVQVFVENAFVHGLDSICDNRKFFLSAKLENEMLVIKIGDNGEGMSYELTQAMCLRDDEKLKKASHGIGIKNVISRLNLYFDNEYKIFVTSEPYESTEITMVLPIKRN